MMKKRGLLEAKNISLEKNGKMILDGVNFSIPSGRITCFIGESGAGKSSVLRVISQLEKEYTGTVFLDGVDVAELSNKDRAREIGFLFQDFNLFAGMTAEQNCLNPLTRVFGVSKEEAQKKVNSIFSELNLDSIRDKYPSSLSGGQKQRVALARVLVTDPEVILFDEPTSALDPSNAKVVSNILQELVQRGVCIGIASHDPVLLTKILDRVYKVRDGKIVEDFDKERDKCIDDKPLICEFLKHHH